MVGWTLAGLVEDEIEMVRLLWCDLVGLTRGIAHRIEKVQQSPWMPLPSVEMALGVMIDAPKLDCGIPTAEQVYLHLDESTLRMLPYASGHASGYGDILDANGEPWLFCPRGFLKRQIATLASMGLQIKAAFESEFVLFDLEDGEMVPTDQHGYASIQALNMKHEVLEAIRAALDAQNIQVTALLAESASGQHEIVVQHVDVLAAADQQLVVRETVHAVARQLGMIASFLPVLFEKEGGNGSHVHLSLWRNGKNVTGDAQQADGLSEETAWFMAGILSHLEALLSVTTPTTNSFRRIQPGHWSGAYLGWGFDNKEMPLRVPKQPGASPPSNIEIKACDATSNPYLALGVLLAAGIDGLKNHLVLRQPVPHFPAAMGASEQESLGLTQLPDTLEKSLDCFEADQVLSAALGIELFNAYTGIKRDEVKLFSGMSLDDEIQCLLERH